MKTETPSNLVYLFTHSHLPLMTHSCLQKKPNGRAFESYEMPKRLFTVSKNCPKNLHTEPQCPPVLSASTLPAHSANQFELRIQSSPPSLRANVILRMRPITDFAVYWARSLSVAVGWVRRYACHPGLDVTLGRAPLDAVYATE